MSYASVSVSFSPVFQTALLSAGDDIFNVRAGSLYGAVFNGGTGTDTLNLIGGGTFDLTTATLSSIEVIRGTSSTDTIVLNARILSGIKTLSGGGGGNFLKLSGSGTYNFAGKSVIGFTRIDATTKGFTGAVFDNKATALLLWAQKSQGDSLTLRGGIFTEEERAQLHRQGVDIVIDDSGRYENSAPILRSLDRDRVYTSGAQAFLDRDFDASVGGLDDRLSSLKVIFDDDWMLPGEILIVENPSLTLPDGLVDGGGILFEGTLIGTVVLLGDGFIEVIFNAEATKSAVEALLHALAYRNLDPDPLVRTVNVSMTLTDEGGRFTQVFVEVLAGNADIQFLDQKTNLLAGTEDDDIFATDSLGLTEGDAIDGGNGTDTLLLIGGSSFDLTQLGSLIGIEDIRGSDSRDWITIHGSQLADIRTIDGGEVGTGGSLGDNANLLSILGTDIDLRGKTFLNFSAIRLMSENAVVTVADKTVAKMISGTQAAHARLVLTGGESFTATEKGVLFRHGIETITDASGTYVNEAPDIGNLGGDRAFGVAGHAIFLDLGQNALLTEDDQAFSSLTVSVQDGTATDRLGLASTGRVQVIETAGGILRIYVKGVNIGFISSPAAGGSELTIQFNEKSAPNLVQEVLRALTYTDMSGTVTAPREINLRLTDYTYHSTEVSVTVEQELNTQPTDIALDGSFISELSSAGTVVGVLGATDDNESDTFSYTLLNDAGGRFTLNGNVLVVKQGTKLDYEQASAHLVTVRVTDKLGLTFNKTFTIDVVNVEGEVAIGTRSRDVFVGGDRNDRLYGKLGNDVLTGGLGKDVFVFDTALNRSTNVDTITDFSVKDDTIWLENAVFRKLTRTGVLNKDFFTIGTAAKDKNDYIVYDNKTGALSYDADGSGKGAAIKFAQLGTHLKMTYADFLVI